MESVHEFFSQAVQQFPFWKDDLRPRLETSLGKYLGRAASVGLRPSIQTMRDWLEQQLAVSFAAEAGGALTPLERMGDGWQSLVRLAALEALRSYEPASQHPVLLLHEEPETYLHPHLRRKLRDVLEGLCAAGWLSVCSTHAPEFISFSRAQQVIRLWRKAKTEKGWLLSAKLPEGLRFQEKLDERGAHEFLFAKRVVFCEGKDDRFAVSGFLEKGSIDLDGLGVSIVDLGSAQTHFRQLAATVMCRVELDRGVATPESVADAKCSA
jgi:hypothetical protein